MGTYKNEGHLNSAISQNIDSKTFERLLKDTGGDKSKAYISWLHNYTTNTVVPRDFRETKK